MREIIFRGKRLDHGEWVCGNLIVPGNEYIGKPKVLISEYLGEHCFVNWTVAPTTVGQYTGLDDKNGKKIFEGDIMDYMGKPARIEMRAGCWEAVRSTGIGYCLGYENKHYTVIGNIHDNPKLMNNGKGSKNHIYRNKNKDTNTDTL